MVEHVAKIRPDLGINHWQIDPNQPAANLGHWSEDTLKSDNLATKPEQPRYLLPSEKGIHSRSLNRENIFLDFFNDGDVAIHYEVQHAMQDIVDAMSKQA